MQHFLASTNLWLKSRKFQRTNLLIADLLLYEMRSGYRIILMIAGRLLQRLMVGRCGNAGRHDGRQPGRSDWWSRWRRLGRTGSRLLRMRCQSAMVETRFLQLGGLRLVNIRRQRRRRLNFSFFVLQVIHFRLANDGIHIEHSEIVVRSAKRKICLCKHSTTDIFTAVNNRFACDSLIPFHYHKVLTHILTPRVYDTRRFPKEIMRSKESRNSFFMAGGGGVKKHDGVNKM